MLWDRLVNLIFSEWYCVAIRCVQRLLWLTISKLFQKLSTVTAKTTAYHFQWSSLAKRPLILVLLSARTLRDSYLIRLSYLLFFSQEECWFKIPRRTTSKTTTRANESSLLRLCNLHKFIQTRKKEFILNLNFSVMSMHWEDANVNSFSWRHIDFRKVQTKTKAE